MACLLVLVVAATVLTGPPGKLTHAARTSSPAEAFWRAALHGAPMPEAIRELLRPGAAGTNALDDARPRHHDAEPPPMEFKYDDYKSTPGNEVAAPSAEVLDRVAGARNAAASPTVFFPGAPMPESIGELLLYGTNARSDFRRRTMHHDEDPPLGFNYDNYKSTPRNEVAAPSAEVLDRVAGAQNAAASPTVFFPGAPMPESIRELLRHGTKARSDFRRRTMHHDDDPPPLPPMNFKYGDYKSTPRNKAAAPSPEVLDRVAGARNAAVSPTVLFLEEEAVRVGGILPFRSIIPRDATNAAAAASPPLRLYTVRAVRAVDGCRFVVCRREAGPGDDESDAVYGCRATGPARAYVVGMVGERGETATAAVVCRTDVSRWNQARAAFLLLGVKPGGAAAVCRAALDAQVIPVKDRSSSLV